MSEFELNELRLRDVLMDPLGPVGLFLEEACIRVESQAKVNATGDRRNPNRVGPAVRTGNLRGRIYPHVEVTPAGLVGLVTSPVEYSGYVETGTSRSRPYPYLRPALSAV